MWETADVVLACSKEFLLVQLVSVDPLHSVISIIYLIFHHISVASISFFFTFLSLPHHHLAVRRVYYPHLLADIRFHPFIVILSIYINVPSIVISLSYFFCDDVIYFSIFSHPFYFISIPKCYAEHLSFHISWAFLNFSFISLEVVK